MSNSQPEFGIPTALVDTYSRYIQSPVQRLKFLDRVLKAKSPRANLLLKIFGWLPVIGSLNDRAFLVIELAKFLPAKRKLPLSIRLVFILHKLRYGVYAACMLLVVSATGGLVYLCARVAGDLSPSTEAKGPGGGSTDSASASNPGGASAGAKAMELVASKAGLPLDQVWLADHGDGFEFYSNGARVLTEFETAGRERKFYRFHFTGDDGKKFQPVMMSKPVGIVFHISESDKLPFAYNYNSSLQSVSRALLDYAKQHRLYNYIIDRFGRIYRIVRDEDSANHAGYSLWADKDDFFIDLNSSFIGICFEGKSARGSAIGPDGINEAQIYAARILTAVLRSKYGIDDADCVTHGLVSVNPDNGLLGFHTDWVSEFPFQAMGLSDKYQADLPAISKFGFTYDQAYISSAGGARWPGLQQADARLKEIAAQDGVSIQAERSERFKVFQAAYRLQHALDKGADAGKQDASTG
jgi:hypothetical protein